MTYSFIQGALPNILTVIATSQLSTSCTYLLLDKEVNWGKEHQQMHFLTSCTLFNYLSRNTDLLVASKMFISYLNLYCQATLSLCQWSLPSVPTGRAPYLDAMSPTLRFFSAIATFHSPGKPFPVCRLRPNPKNLDLLKNDYCLKILFILLFIWIIWNG